MLDFRYNVDTMNRPIIEISQNYVAQVSQMFEELVAGISKETQDPYFKYDNFDMDLTKSMLESLMDDVNAKVYLVVDEKKQALAFIAAQLQSNLLPFSKVSKVGYIIAAYVKPEYRKQGLMTDLENNLLKFFQKEKVEYVDLNALSKNCLGINCWKKLGYETFRVQMRKKI